MNTKKIIVPVMVLTLVGILTFGDKGFMQSAYALTLDNFSIAGSPNVFQIIGENIYVINTSTGAFNGYDITNGDSIFSATADTTGSAFRGFRCNTTDCWQMRTQGTTDCYLTRLSAITGTQEQQIHYTNDCSGSSDIGINGASIYFGRKCTTGDIGSSGAGDTDLAVFSVDGDSMAGTPVQHTDCGADFSPISSSSQGLIGYKAISGSGSSRLAVITNGASGAVDIFTYVSLTQDLSTTTNTVLCSVSLTSSNTFGSASGRNIQSIGLTAYVNGNVASSDSYVINIITSTCGKSSVSSFTAFNAGQADLSLDSTNGILYLGGTEADGTGLLVIGYDFAGNVVTTTPIVTVTPDSTASSIGAGYSTTRDTGYIVTASKVYLLEYGNEEEEETGGNQNDGVCGVGTALDCVGDRGTIGNIFYGTGGTSEPITATANNLLVGVGIVNSTNTDTETNGTGLFLMLITGVFFFTVSVSSVAVANNKFNAGISYGDTVMNAYYLLFLVVGVLAIAFYLNWIPDLVFYGLVVGLAGLFSFGVYRHMARGG